MHERREHGLGRGVVVVMDRGGLAKYHPDRRIKHAAEALVELFGHATHGPYVRVLGAPLADVAARLSVHRPRPFRQVTDQVKVREGVLRLSAAGRWGVAHMRGRENPTVGAGVDSLANAPESASIWSSWLPCGKSAASAFSASRHGPSSSSV